MAAAARWDVFAFGAATVVATPRVVPQLARIVQLSGGGRLALDADGALWAFPLYADATATAIVAYKIPGISKIARISRECGLIVSVCEFAAIDTDGKAWAVGLFGSVVTPGPGVAMVTAVSGWPLLSRMECSGHCLAVDVDGNVWAKGNNFYGQLGDGSNINKTLPVRLTALSGIKEVAVGGNYSYAISSTGALYSWGDYFLNGRDDRIANNSPSLVPSLSGVQEIAVGTNDRLVRLSDGTVWGWGANQLGELGTVVPGASYVPVRVTGVNIN